MTRILRWSLVALVTLVVLFIGLLIAARLYVGGISVVTGQGQVDPHKLAERIKLPDGFSMGVYAANIPRARILRFSRAGDLLVAIPNENRIVLLSRDANGDKQADGARVLMRDLNGPNGLDFHGPFLYVAEQDAIGRIAFDHASGELVGEYERIVTGLPGGENHWKKTLRVGPDEKLYVAMGSSCNVCIEQDARRATLVTYNLDGSDEEIFASGLRNSAGFDWRPADGAIYATDNGRDMLGDDFPPCELNRVERGQHYGWPFANGDKIPDPDFGQGNEEIIERSIAPVHGFRAHNAPLGIEFVRGTAFPPDYRDAAIVALHGSWNRSEKDGYKVVSVHFRDDGSVEERDLVSGFLDDGDVIGRPAEVTQGPDGAFYVSDDYAGAVYRIAYGEEQALTLPMIELIEYDPAESLATFTDEERETLFAEGKALVEREPCMGCHAGGIGGAKPFANIGTRYDVDTLKAFLAKPTPPMPLFAHTDRLKAFLAKPTPPMPLFAHTDRQRTALAVYLITTY